jgi:hypothetical protein
LEPVVAGGWSAIPAGSFIEGVVEAAKPAHGVNAGYLSVRLTGLEWEDSSVEVKTSLFRAIPSVLEEQSPGTASGQAGSADDVDFLRYEAVISDEAEIDFTLREPVVLVRTRQPSERRLIPQQNPGAILTAALGMPRSNQDQQSRDGFRISWEFLLSLAIPLGSKTRSPDETAAAARAA